MPAGRSPGTGMEALGKLVRACTGTGHEHAVGVIVGIATEPTYVLRCADGARVHWAASLCEELGPKARAEWLVARASAAEAVLRELEAYAHDPGPLRAALAELEALMAALR